MSTLLAFFVKCSAGDRVSDAIRSRQSGLRDAFSVRQLPTHDWVEVEYASLDEPRALMQAISSELDTEVVGFQIQTTADVFVYRAFRSGAELRVLEHGQDGWTTALGWAEPWEESLFSTERLEEALEGVDDDEEAALLRKLFASKKIEVGPLHPWPNPWDAIERRLNYSEAQFRELHSSSPVATMRGTSGRVLGGMATWLISAGLIAAVLSGALAKSAGPGVVGLVGSLVIWVGCGLKWRRASAVTAWGGGFIAGMVLFILGFSVGSLFR